MNKQIKDAIVISVVVLLIIIMVYFMSSVFITKELGGSKETTTTTAKTYNNIIMAGKTFDQKEDKYMVVFFSSDDVDEDLEKAIDAYNKDDLKLYKVNLDEAINNYVKAKTDNKIPSDSSDLKVKDVALITLENNKVIEYETNTDKIIEKLK